MQKTTKAAVAAGAAALLLAGGAGTMAAWSDTADLGGGSVQTGELSITQDNSADAGWYWGTEDVEGQKIPDISKVHLAPGDSVTYTGTYNLTVTGDNLAAKVDVDGGELSGDLKDEFDVTSTGEDLSNITEDTTVTAGATLTFKDSAEGEGTMNKTVNLSGITITLEQTAPASV